jgi:hypothetical protein
MGLLKFLLIVIVVYYGFRFIFRLVLPFLVQYLFKKTQQKMNDQFGTDHTHQQKKEGEVTINQSENKRQHDQNAKDGSGEYVDFEDV